MYWISVATLNNRFGSFAGLAMDVIPISGCIKYFLLLVLWSFESLRLLPDDNHSGHLGTSSTPS